MTIKTLQKEMLRLDPIDRIHMVEHILNSLDKPDPEIERAWAKESDRRLNEYKKGKVRAVSLEEVKKKLRLK